jgi:hypothetical protein
MKYAADRPFADSDKAARKLLEIANTIEAVQDGRIHIEKLGPSCSRKVEARPNTALGSRWPSRGAGSGSMNPEPM